MCRESCAIVYYLVEKYDVKREISVENFEEKMIEQQWLFFQASGQGCGSSITLAFSYLPVYFFSPYYGQCGWFKAISPPPRIPEAIERYQKEILRILGVLESVLSKQEWLVGGKCTCADLVFIMLVVPSPIPQPSMLTIILDGTTLRSLSSLMTTRASISRRTSQLLLGTTISYHRYSCLTLH